MIVFLLFVIAVILLLELTAQVCVLLVKALVGASYMLAWMIAGAGAVIGWALGVGRPRDVW